MFAVLGDKPALQKPNADKINLYLKLPIQTKIRQVEPETAVVLQPNGRLN
jgi:hypothetical protein